MAYDIINIPINQSVEQIIQEDKKDDKMEITISYNLLIDTLDEACNLDKKRKERKDLQDALTKDENKPSSSSN